MRAYPHNWREMFSVAAIVITVVATVLFSRAPHAADQRRQEIATLRAHLDREKADLDQMQRDLAADDAFNKAAADEIHLLQTNH